MGNQQQCLKAGRCHIHFCLHVVSQNLVTWSRLAARKPGKSILYAGWPCAWLTREDLIIKKKRIDSGGGGSQHCLHSSPRISNLTWIKWKYHFLRTFPFPSVLLPPHPSGGAILWGRGWQGEVSPKLSGEQRENCAMKLNSRWPGIEIKDPKQKVPSWSKWGWGLLSQGPRCLLR